MRHTEFQPHSGRHLLAAMSAYVEYALEKTEDAKTFKDLFDSTEKEIMRLYADAFDGDLGS